MNLKKITLVACLVMAVVLMPALAQNIPQTMNYQGQLLDPGTKQPKPDGAYNFEFRIYDSIPAQVWSEIQNGVPVNGGLFNVTLGEFTLINLSFNDQYELEIWVGGEKLSPRIKLNSVGYAFQAEEVDGFSASTIAAADRILALNSNTAFVITAVNGLGPLIEANNDAGAGSAIRGTNQSGTGIEAVSDVRDAFALHARNTGGTGSGDMIGVYGEGGVGVAGRSTEMWGVGIGGKVEAVGNSGVAVIGLNIGGGDRATGMTGILDNKDAAVTAYGVLGSTNTLEGAGVFGVADNPNTKGVSGINVKGAGISAFGMPAIEATSTTRSARAIMAANTGEHGAGSVVAIEGNAATPGNEGIGVQGVGQYGIVGASTNTVTNGIGVYGENTTAANTAAGVYGLNSNGDSTPSVITAGVSGSNQQNAGVDAVGVYGFTQSRGAAGVMGENLAVLGAGDPVGVRGIVRDSKGVGVEGLVDDVTPGGTQIGVRGWSNSSDGTGVKGMAEKYAVHGITGTAGGYGIFAENTANAGGPVALRAEATAGISGTGVQGESFDFGVYGIARASGGAGVFGQNTDNAAVGNQVGVRGDASALKGIGVVGENWDMTPGGAQVGVKGTVNSSDGIGVHGENVIAAGGSTAIGVLGEALDAGAVGTWGRGGLGGTGVTAENMDASGASEALRVVNGTVVVSSPILGRRQWTAGMNEAVDLGPGVNVLKPESMIIVTIEGNLLINFGTVTTTYGTPNSFMIHTSVNPVPVNTWYSFLIINPY